MDIKHCDKFLQTALRAATPAWERLPFLYTTHNINKEKKMTNLNDVVISGNICSDPKTTKTANGKEYLSFSVAINHGKDSANFVPVRMAAAQASDKTKEAIRKGNGILIRGRAENPAYEKDGKKMQYFYIAPDFIVPNAGGSMNIATLMGNITREIELKQTTSGKAVCSFTIASNRSYKDASGEWKEAPVSFINVVAWEKTAEFVSKYFHKGDPILVNGHIQSRQYDNKDGEKRTAYELVTANVSFAGKKDKDAQPAAPVSAPAKAAPATTTAPAYGAGAYDMADFTAIDDADDLPF